MSGTHRRLGVDAASFATDHDTRVLVQRATEHILSTQYVRLPIAPEYSSHCWQVMCGSGMGLSFSGEVSDASFARQREIGFIDTPELCEGLGISFYARFKDDIFGIADS